MSKETRQHESSPAPTKPKSWWGILLRVFFWFFIGLGLLFVCLVLFIRSHTGQDLIVSKATTYLSDKTQTTISIDKLFLTFSGKLDLRGVYVEDQKGDTLVYSKELQLAIPLLPALKGHPISINRAKWEGLQANIYRKDSIEGFNFGFIADAFASEQEEQPEKEPSSSSKAFPEIRVGKIDFSDFKIQYRDSVSGIFAHLDLGKLSFNGKNTDLKEMRFEAKELRLEDTRAHYKQTKAFEQEEDTLSGVLPYIAVDHFLVNNVKLHYEALSDSMDIQTDIHHLAVKESTIDLPQNRLKFDRIQWDESFASFALWRQTDSETAQVETATEFEWPNWEILANELLIDKIHFIYQGTKEPQPSDTFSSDYIDLDDLSFSMEGVELSKEETLQSKLKGLTFKESSGTVLDELSFDLKLTGNRTELEGLTLQTKHSSIKGKLEAEYKELEDFIAAPQATKIVVDLPIIDVDLNEVYNYLPALKENPYLQTAALHKIKGQLRAGGSLADLNVSRLRLNWGADTQLATAGRVRNLLDVERLYYQLEPFQIRTLRSDVLQFMDDQDYGFQLPDTLLLAGSFSGTLHQYQTRSKLTSSDGVLSLNAVYGEAAYQADLEVEELNLGKLLKQPDLGYVSLSSSVEGSGVTLNELSGDFNVEVPQLQYRDYDFTALKIEGHLLNGVGNTTLRYEDENLDFMTQLDLKLDSIAQFVTSKVEVKKAALDQLHLYSKRVNSKLKMSAELENRSGDLNFQAHIEQGVASYQGWDHQLGEVDFSGSLRDKETAFSIKSNFLNGEMKANANMHILGLAFKRQLRRYFTDSIYALDSIKDPVHLQMHLQLNENDIVNNVLFPEIEMDTLRFDVNFLQKDELLSAQITLPKLEYENYVIKNLFFNLNSASDVAQYIVGFENFDAGAFGMYRTFLSGDLQDGTLTTNFFAFNEEDDIFYSAHSETTGKEGNLHFHLLPENLMLDGKEWTIAPENELIIQKDSILAKNFVLRAQDQKLELANDLVKINRSQIGLNVENFELQNLLGLFNPDKNVASGVLQGRLVAINPRKRMGLLGDLTIEDLNVLATPLGDLAFRAFSRDTDTYRFTMELKGDDTDVDAKGVYSLKSGEDATIDLNFNLNRFGFETIAGLSQNELDDASGDLKGEFKVEGKLSDPQYDGFLQFDNASFRVAQINSHFTLADEKIVINNYGLTVTQFAVEDENQHRFLIDGAVLTRKWQNPEFDLKMRAENFQLMNSTAKDNSLYYGKLNFNLFGYIEGKMSLPEVFVNLDINKETDFTYVYSESQAGLEKREGIVEFVNKENREPVFVKRDSTFLERIKGIQLHAKVNVDKKAKVSLVIDPRTGDNIEIQGEGALDYRMERNGTSALTGRYIIDKGHYQMNLYNLVKREFQFKQGSKIVWNGDPMDADLDISATYETKASVAGLMVAESGGLGVGENNQYKRRLPFLVYLNVEGTIEQPDLSFGLDMPESSKGELGGAVYGKVSQLNEDEGELNRQVFSLLVLKQFFPQAGSDGSTGGFAGVARDNLTDALADQLSNFSDELLGSTGVRLNFGLDSYTDYQGQSSQQRTDLSVSAEKSLFNDRLIVQAGTEVNVQGDTRPGEESPLLGNVSIEYLLTEDGRWRIRGFRNDEYDNVIDGQVFVNGIGLIFQRDFTRFNYLWRSFIGNPEKYYSRKRKEREEKKQQEEMEKSEENDSGRKENKNKN